MVDHDVVQIGALKSGDVVLTDPTVSRRHAEILRTPSGILLRDLGSTNGTFVGPVKIKEVFLVPETRFRCGRTELVFTPEDEVIDVTPSVLDHFEGLVGSSIAMREVFGILERIAPTDLTVLIAGETGTGKELASRAVHARSRRSRGPFVVFDCGAAPDNLIESELFGHNRGAFTGAVDARPGVFELADGGTIFLDEVGELPLELQPKLLRVLEQREVRRIGASVTKSVDVRIVCATNRTLREEVDAGRFRDDLYYRLAVVELNLPPLRSRISDLPLLCEHLLGRADHNHGVIELSDQVQAIFQAYHWPGNVRELNNVLERAIPFSEGDRVTIDALPQALRAAGKTRRIQAKALGTLSAQVAAATDRGGQFAERPFKDAKDQIIEAFEREYLLDLLERHQGNVSKAARAADMDRKSITRLMKKHGIGRPS
ncbi:MAG: sigma 54-dependent Fis family transcriptional regulator [Oligoflexia bacterium]|nr:sigma 54-dependent Fis family transcriptional regulator [Oligoflexia bacterium]